MQPQSPHATKFYSYLQLKLASSLFSVLSPITSENYANDWLENFAQFLSLYYRKKRQKRQNDPFYYSSHTMHLLNVLNTAKRRCEKYPSASNLWKMSAIARDVNIFIKLDTAVFVDSFTKRNSGLNGCFKQQKRPKTSNVPNVMIHNDVKLQQNFDIAEALKAFLPVSSTTIGQRSVTSVIMRLILYKLHKMMFLVRCICLLLERVTTDSVVTS